MGIPKWINLKRQPWKWIAVNAIASLMVLILIPAAVPAAWGQVPQIPGLNTVERVLTSITSQKIGSGTVKLDGHKLFQVGVPAASDTQQKTTTRIDQRVQDIEARLAQLVKGKIDPAIQVTSQPRPTQQGNQLSVIYVNGQYLMTVTTLDAELQGTTPSLLADEWSQTIKKALLRAKQERQPEYLRNQGLLAGSITLAIILGSLGLSDRQHRNKTQREALSAHVPRDITTSLITASDTGPLTMAAMQEKVVWREQRNINDIQRWLLQFGQLAIWGGGTFVILGLFPYTRWLQVLILSALQAPLKILGIGLGTYVVIRGSAVLIDHFVSALEKEKILAPEASQRLALRVSTFSLVLKRTIALVCVGVGTLTALATVGINVGPLLAGAGIIGLAISFASQSVIKDMINGFLILLEDQYAVGDVIVVGDVGGLVENINLRITQLRNDEGRLITIPNSEISIVQNLSKDWSRVDLKLHIAYDADLNHALEVIGQVGLEMSRERFWRHKILETPEVLGVDELQHAGIMIRVWIKTQPLQQWSVAREYRRRLKLALDEEVISVGIPQQSILLRRAQSSRKNLDTSDGQPHSTASSNRRGS